MCIGTLPDNFLVHDINLHCSTQNLCMGLRLGRTVNLRNLDGIHIDAMYLR